MTEAAPWLGQVRDHLQKALEAEAAVDKNFHIRAALQELSADRHEPA